MHQPRLDFSAAPHRRVPAVAWTRSIVREGVRAFEDAFRFLNVVRPVASPGDWNDPVADKLWLYNLHYFDTLCSTDTESGRYDQAALIERWIDENPPGQGNGWEPYPLSLRIVNWIRWELSGHQLSDRALHSLAIQVRWLSKSVEWHLLGNHLLANAKALALAGLFFDGREADRWFAQGFSIVMRQLDEQVLGDGGHFELSPMYHHVVLEDLLDLMNGLKTIGRTPPPELKNATRRMLKWSAVMCHPDGQIPFFNDSALGIAPSHTELVDYAERLGFEGPEQPVCDGVAWLKDSGYVRSVREDSTLFVDVAKVGPGYIPGHAHADTLSFEFSLGRHRVFVNSGTSCYGAGVERQRQRGTAAHNTVTVEDEDSSEVWAGFRVARRAHPRDVMVREAQTGVTEIRGNHDGYRRLSRDLVHHRRWCHEPGSLKIDDTVGGKPSSAVARFHLAPDIGVQVAGKRAFLRTADGTDLVFEVLKGKLDVEASTYHPEFGLSVESRCLVVSLKDGVASTACRWPV